MNSAEPTWVAAEQPPVPEPSPPNGERVSNPTANVKEEDGKTPLPVDAHQLCLVFFLLYLHLVAEEGCRSALRRKQLASFLAD